MQLTLCALFWNVQYPVNDTLVLTEREKVSDCMTTFFIGAGEPEYAGPPSIYVDGAAGSPDKEPVQASTPPSLAPTQHAPMQHAPTPSADNVERLEKKIDDLQSKVSHLTAMVRAIM